MFVLQGSQIERIFFHYPRLQTITGAEESVIPLDAKNKNGQSRIPSQWPQFLAMPVTGIRSDGERVVCYRSFLPACANALV